MSQDAGNFLPEFPSCLQTQGPQEGKEMALGGRCVTRKKVAIVEAYLRGLAGKGIGASDLELLAIIFLQVTSSMRNDKC
jgi:hypothetical protein